MSRTACPLCDSDADVFLTRGDVPVRQNFVFRSRHEAESVPRGDLRFAVCPRCGFVFNAAFDPELVPYGTDYENNQTCSPSFNSYADDLVRYLVEERGVRDSRVVEVGCGQGYFLRRLVAFAGANNAGVGFDPSYRGPESDLDGRLRFVRAYYDASTSDVAADVVVCRHVIEHVKQPLDLLRNVGAAPRVFFETPCAQWIFDNDAFWDIFYEHCSLFTAGSLAAAFARRGFRLESVRHVFEGQYLLAEGVRAGEVPAERGRSDIRRRAFAFAERSRALEETWRAKIATIAAGERIAIWGAGAKGVTFANVIDPRRQTIDCLVDLNPAKHGTYVSGTGHEVVDYRALRERGVTVAIVMNPNYVAENRRILSEAGTDVRLLVAE
jgi:SAM-dependent methyltransferase